MRPFSLAATLTFALGACSQGDGGKGEGDGSDAALDDAQVGDGSHGDGDPSSGDGGPSSHDSGSDAGGASSAKAFFLNVFMGAADGSFTVSAHESLAPLLGTARPSQLALIERRTEALRLVLADNQALSLLEVDHDGRIQAAFRTTPQLPSQQSLEACTVAVGDYDGDTNMDVLTSCPPTRNVRLFRGGVASDFELQPFEAALGQVTVYDAELFDIYGDKRAEVVALTQKAEGGVLSIEALTFETTLGTWSKELLGTVAHRDGAEVVLGDVDADGKADVAVSDIYGAQVWRQEANAFAQVPEPSIHSYHACVPKAAARLVDLDADGQVDLFSWFGWLNDFECTYAASPEPLYAVTPGHFVLLSDYDPRAIEIGGGAFGLARVDADDLPDLVTLDDGEINTRFSVPGRTWSAPVRSALKSYLFDVTSWLLEDVNGDSVPDLIVISRGG